MIGKQTGPKSNCTLDSCQQPAKNFTEPVANCNTLGIQGHCCLCSGFLGRVGSYETNRLCSAKTGTQLLQHVDQESRIFGSVPYI